MAPPKKQKREYNAGDAVWVKVKGWPTWPGVVEDIKKVTNESVLKKKRKNAVLVKFLETGTDSYSWAGHDEINPFQKETFDDFLINTNHKNFNAWKKAFTLVAKEAGLTEADIEATLTKAKTFKSSPSPRKRKERENEETTTPKKRKSSSTSPSPKRTARHASTGDKKKSTPKKAAAAPKKNLLKPTLDSTENLLNELNTLLVKYNTSKEDEKVYQLLKIISNFALADHAILSTVAIGDTIKHLSTEEDHIQNIPKIAIKITEYYDSLKKVEEKEEEKKEEEKEEVKEEVKEEEKKEENGEVKTESSEEKKEGEDIVISENTEVKPADDKMETENPTESEAKPAEETATSTA